MGQSVALERKVFACIKEYSMIASGQKIMVGVSGGADSVCLLFMLKEYSQTHEIELAVVHIDHGLRPEAAAEAKYVRGLCEELKLPFYFRRINIHDDCAARGMSVEEAARELRYGAFRECASDWRADRIAVAHNADDNAETMLFHLFRGSGVRGLAGIPPVRGEIIRPLLTCRRAEIEEYLHSRGISYCTDASNREDTYTRNRIRHHILPYANEQIAEGCVERMGQTAGILRETEDFLEKNVVLAREICVERLTEPGDDGEALLRMDIRAYAQLHPAVGKRLLLGLLLELTASGRDVGWIHVRKLHELLTIRGNRELHFPEGIIARREYDHVFLGCELRPAGNRPGGGMSQDAAVSREGQEDQEGRSCYPVEAAGGGEKLGAVIAGRGALYVRLLERMEKPLCFPQNQYTKWLDYDRIEEPLVLRTRESGDRLTIGGAGEGQCRHKSLKKYMVEEKIPKAERECQLLLASGHDILWVIGRRIGEYYKVREDTRRILEMRWMPLEDAGAAKKRLRNDKADREKERSKMEVCDG